MKIDLEETINKSKTLSRFDHKLIVLMRKHAEPIEKVLLGIYFMWFGLIKVFGGKSASSIIAKTIYWIDPNIGVPALGVWEVLIGVCLIFSKFNRIAILLLIVRIPGVIMALIYHYELCFPTNFLEPSIQGQYLIKQITLIGATLVIGSSIRIQGHSNF